MIFGGGNLTYVYLLKPDHSGIVQADGTAAATLTSHALIAFGGDVDADGLLGSGLTFDEAGVPTLTLDTIKMDPAVTDFLKIVAPKKATSGGVTRNEQTLENGRKLFSAGTGNNPDVLVIAHGGAVEGPSGTGKAMVTVVPMKFKLTSGGRTVASPSDPVKPTLEGLGVPAKADISIPAALFGDRVTVAAAQILAKDFMSEDLFFTLA